MAYASQTAAPAPRAPTAARVGVRLRGFTAPQVIVTLIFAVVLITTMALPVLKVAVPLVGVNVPVRSTLAAGMLLLLVVYDDAAAARAIARHQLLLYLTFGFGLLGAGVSTLNRMPPLELVQQILEIHVQAAVNLLLGAIVVELVGMTVALYCFLLAVGLTAVVAVAQFFGVHYAWNLRLTISMIQHETGNATFSQYGYLFKQRPMGLSFSPIVLATQLCLAFAAYGIVQQKRLALANQPKSFSLRVIAAIFLFIFICVASGNRSPIVGGLIFLMIYTATRNGRLFWLAGPMLALFAFFVVPTLYHVASGTGSRVASVDDQSSLARVTLTYYGFRLFVDHPIGYGLGFDPTLYWQQYWGELASMPNAIVVATFPLHNYVLNMANFYGIGSIALFPMIGRVMKQYSWALLYFVPYAFHIMFHNMGPFWNDAIIWFVLAIAAGDSLGVPGRWREVELFRPPSGSASAARRPA